MSVPWPRPCAPTPWRWQCHKCKTWYILSCTRRCLECSHVFCQRYPSSSPAPSSLFSSPSSASGPDPRGRARKRRQKQRRTKSSKSSGGPCASEFDYQGWAAHGSWRRRMSLLARQRKEVLPSERVGPTGPSRRLRRLLLTAAKPGGGRTVEKEAYMTWKPRTSSTSDSDDAVLAAASVEGWYPRAHESQERVLKRKAEELYLRGSHDCSLHCDWPNECGHSIFNATKEA